MNEPNAQALHNMEFDFSLVSPTAHTIAISAYIDFLPLLQYFKPLGTSRFLKTIQCLSSEGYVVTKLLIKPSSVEIDMKPYLNKLNEVKQKLQNIPNTLAFDTLIDSDRATYLIRPYVRYNLYDRLSIRPFFENIEKKWIVYQLLVALTKMHDVGVYHGDIKTENVLLTSWNSIMLSDIALFKPVYLPDYNQTHFSFYFDTVQRHSCCIAPERFKTKEELDNISADNNKLLPGFDIFSLGCVIAELYSDGLPLFSLPQMFKYKKGEYSPKLDSIEDTNIKKLVQNMISLNPTDRLTAKEYLSEYRKTLFPDYFYTFLYSYMNTLSNSPSSSNSEGNNFQKCDYRIDRMYKDFDKIALYLGFKTNIIDTDEFNSSNSTNRQDNIIPVKLNLPGMNRHIPRATSKIITKNSYNDFGSLIFLSLLNSNVRNTTHSSYRIKACELILAFSEQLHDEAKFDRCLPYLVNMLDDPSENVQVSALICITQMLMMIDTITPINIHIFSEYIIPKLQVFLNRSYIRNYKETKDMMNTSGLSNSNNIERKSIKSGNYVRMIFAACLPYLAMSSKKVFELSILLKNKVGTYHDPDIDSIIFNERDKNDLEFDSNFESFETLTTQILTDSNVYVRIALMQNIKPLCSFFGKQKTNDIILSHVITYLNDKDPQIKLSFVASIVPLSVFVGMTSLEQYILPLLLQSIYGPEETIVITLLRALSQLISLRMIRHECFADLLNLSVILIIHPNGLVRQSILKLIIVISSQIPVADFYCLLYPIVRPYLQHEVEEFTWKNIYISCHEPLTRVVFETLKLWCLSNQESLFWKKSSTNNPYRDVDMFGIGKLKFLRKNEGNLESRDVLHKSLQADTYTPNYQVPLSNTDLKFLGQIISLGLDAADIWKIASFRSYIYKLTRLNIRSSNIKPNSEKLHLAPRNVFIDVTHKYIPKSAKQQNSDIKEFAQLNINTLSSKNDPNKNQPLILKNLQAPRPIVMTSDKSVYSSDTNNIHLPSNENSIFDNFGEGNVFDETMKLKEIHSDVRISYPGKNTSILKFLNGIKFEPEIGDYPEFGRFIDTNLISKKNSQNTNHILHHHDGFVAMLIEHNSSIVDIVAAPQHEFFISCDSEGFLKIWDTHRLEVDVTGDSCLSVNLGSPIKSLCMMPGRNCFAVSKLDGSVDIYRVDFVGTFDNDDKNRYQKTSITLIRHYKLDKAKKYATNLTFCLSDNLAGLYMITATSKLIGIDIRAMVVVYEYPNNILHGNAVSLVVDKSQKWAVIGSDKGIIDLIDIDAKICIKSTKFKYKSYPITKMFHFHDFFSDNNTVNSLKKENNNTIAFVGGTGNADVVIWDVNSGRPRKVMCSYDKGLFSAEAYLVIDVTDDIINEVHYEPDNLNSFTQNHSNTSISYSYYGNQSGKLLTASYNKEIIDWGLKDVSDTHLVSSSNGTVQTDDIPQYSETQINSTLSFVHQSTKNLKHKNHDEKRDIGIPSKIGNKSPSDLIRALCYVSTPYNMVICGDRSGKLCIYRI
ncbi:ubiquitin-binding serine/threonine protein kinase [Pichia kluyveri]|uniref:non-specific serine/threonine protein kinase n=1 Tax=Pichia kluyveri TaxID=36015 RepID=A0AAV5R8Q5_PICKL|nr:ubiquitin-binding serine/threonine protein kinase [Pichia kluyveri]